MNEDNKNQSWQEVMRDAYCNTALPLVGMLSSGGYLLYESFKQIQHEQDLRNIEKKFLESDIRLANHHFAKLWAEKDNITPSRLIQILEQQIGSQVAGDDFKMIDDFLCNSRFDKSHKIKLFGEEEPYDRELMMKIATGVGIVSVIACIGILGKGVYDAIQAEKQQPDAKASSKQHDGKITETQLEKII